MITFVMEKKKNYNAANEGGGGTGTEAFRPLYIRSWRVGFFEKKFAGERHVVLGLRLSVESPADVCKHDVRKRTPWFGFGFPGGGINKPCDGKPRRIWPEVV